MKILLVLIVLMFTSHGLSAASNSGRINSSSWSLLYGYSKNINEQGYRPVGSAYKFQLGSRWDNDIEANFFLRYASQKDDINFSNTEGNIKRTDITFGVGLGYWIFSAFKVNAGYAFHNPRTEVMGMYSSSQKSTIETNYKLENDSRKGLFAGADLVLLQNKYLQLFTNYEYYHLNHAKAHDWEAMVGIRIYPGAGSSSSSSSKSTFAKLLDWIGSKTK